MPSHRLTGRQSVSTTVLDFVSHMDGGSVPAVWAHAPVSCRCSGDQRCSAVQHSGISKEVCNGRRIDLQARAARGARGQGRRVWDRRTSKEGARAARERERVRVSAASAAVGLLK